jgi:hypothetical protein
LETGAFLFFQSSQQQSLEDIDKRRNKNPPKAKQKRKMSPSSDWLPKSLSTSATQQLMCSLEH